MDRRRRALSASVMSGGSGIINNYLTIVALEDDLTAKLSRNACEYCVDGDGDWKTLSAATNTESINKGQTLSFRGNLTPELSEGIGTFIISKNCNLEGNCMSMLFGDDANNNLSLSGNGGKDYAFYRLFYNCTTIKSVSSGFLPAMTLKLNCYESMFQGCTSLTQAPELPAMTLAEYCYKSMFEGCISLTQAPALPATTLVYGCYYSMFKGCTRLTQAPELPATSLANYCYSYMFYECMSLTQAPELPATSLVNYCYNSMFGSCTSLTQAPALPAITLASYCYYQMFRGCTSLTTAPELPAITLTNSCYEGMFYNCSKLNYIKAMFTTKPSTSYTFEWVNGVASTGKFIKNKNATWNVIATSDNDYIGIPSGWSIRTTIDVNDYLTIVALEDGLTARLSDNACEYCIDGDGDWKTLSDYTKTEMINTGQRLSFRGNLTPTDDGIGRFTISKSCNLEGNCMSMLFGDNASSNISLNGKNYTFYSLFRNCTTIKSVSSGFLPATTLAGYCYNYMFYGCTSLTTAPALPATTLVDDCYSFMFYGCTSLITTPELPATTLESGCYQGMFEGCTSLTQAPELPATTLADSCYADMFDSCTNLTQAPVLPATRLISYCYSHMFRNCASLTQAPELPATALANYCYFCMFQNCTNLTTAPELPATTLVGECYRYMFKGCTKLNYIKALFTTTPSDTYTGGWVDGVASTGTFVKNPDATWNVTGVHGVPSGWTVVESMIINNYLTIIALEDGLTAQLSTNACEYCVDGNKNWKTLSANTNTETINTGQTLSFRGNLTPNSSNGIGTFTVSKNCNLEGNCMSMLFSDDAANNFSLNGKNYAFYKLFQNCTTIKSVSANFLPATTLSTYCYSYMFSNCTNLTQAPVLPATTLASYCYYYMFDGCTSLTTAPSLPATTLREDCYAGMFDGCTSLTTAPELPATTLADSCYQTMFRDCTNLTTTPALPATTLAKICYSYMFNGCTSLTTAPELPATTLAKDCYAGMFSGCTSLTTAPSILPATTLADFCYMYMFEDCINLTTAPELPAITLAYYCYYSMFEDCSKLNYIKAMFITTPSSSYTSYWVRGVASTGTFIKNRLATWDVTGVNGIPEGWTVQTA